MIAALILAGIVLVAFLTLAYTRKWQWTGLAAIPARGDEPGRAAKTLWDWMQLFLVPLVLALAAFGLALAQDTRQQEQEDKRAKRERERAEENAREETLRTYLQQMSQLMLETPLTLPNKRGTRPSQSERNAVTLARTLTLTALSRLDGVRKGRVVQFLTEARLIGSTYRAEPASLVPLLSTQPLRPSRISLEGADLRGLVIRDRLLIDPGRWDSVVDLSGADLRKAVFEGATLMVDFTGADLREANFARVYVMIASFDFSCLSGARFTDARLGPLGGQEAGRAGRADLDRRRVLASLTMNDARGRDVDFSGTEIAGHKLQPDCWQGGRTPGVPGWVRIG